MDVPILFVRMATFGPELFEEECLVRSRRLKGAAEGRVLQEGCPA